MQVWKFANLQLDLFNEDIQFYKIATENEWVANEACTKACTGTGPT